MSKRTKNAGKTEVAGAVPTANEASASTAHPPRKNPTLLAVSVLLFAAWFAFLLVTALMA
jgi:hypothetical protein